jgi:hypothetical protein
MPKLCLKYSKCIRAGRAYINLS